MTAEQAEGYVAGAVGKVLDLGAWPYGARVSVASYRALLARDGLEPRCIGGRARDTLFARVHGFELPVSADLTIADDDAQALALIVMRRT